jgi:anti-sigma regulatory factor (Ser/Thr protein kinase)
MFYEVENTATLQAALQALCDFLHAQNVPQNSVFDCRLVACELLGNVLRHAQGKASIHSEIKDGCVEIRIDSKDIFFPKKKAVCADVYAENGRGLFLVESVIGNKIRCEEGSLFVYIQIEE